MKSRSFDRKFDAGKNVIGQLDMSKLRKPMPARGHVAIDFPIWMTESLDRESKRLGVTKQTLIKIWIAERLDRKSS